MLEAAGLSFRTAPRFHNRVAWAERLRLNGGVERRGSIYVPHGDWRALEAAELCLLVGDHGSATASEPPAAPDVHADLIAIPPHVRTAWWAVAEHDPVDGHNAGYDRFVADVIEFLRFKQLALPDGCRLDVVASRPDQSSTRLSAAGTLAGLAFSASATAETTSGSRVVAVINLGDEGTYLVLLPLAPEAMAASLSENAAGSPGTAPRHELLDRFFRVFPAHPLVRVRLEPGDGLWLPSWGVVYDGWTHGKEDVDIILTIRTGA